MSQPPLPPDDGAPTPPGHGAPGWPVSDGGWPPPGQQPAPDWATTTWQPAAPPRISPPPPARTPGRGRWAVAGAALAGVVGGGVAATLLVSAVFVGSAEDIGRAMGEELAPGLSDGIREGMAEGAQEQMDAAMGLLGEESAGGWYGGAPAGEIEQFPPVEPADLGPDEVLDAYAQGCFDGDLQACDDLMYGSPPLSDYEEYAGTCGGRVKIYTVLSCTELE